LRWLVSDYDCFCSTLNKFLQRFLFLFIYLFNGRGYKLVFPPHTPSAHPSPKHQNPSVFLHRKLIVYKKKNGFQQSASTKMIRTQPS
jgi:hypothetical protein